MTAANLNLALVRAFATLWRFRTLALCMRAANGSSQPQILKRRFMGYTLHLDVSRSNAQRLLYVEGARYVSELPLLRSLVKRGATVVDVGANIGYYVLLFARFAGEAGRIIAFEPEPDNLVELRLNVAANSIRNADVRAQAVGAKRGAVRFRRGINGGVRDDGLSDETVEVPLVALDDEIAQRVDAIKIDVEGYEGEVLSGARRLIERWRPALFVEIHPALMAAPHTVAEVLGFLRRYYGNIELYEPARTQTLGEKVLSRYFGIGAVQRMPAHEEVLARVERGAQDTFWAVCRPGRT